MKLESQVCTPEQGERLKALGVFQKSLFYWTHSEKWGIMYWTSIDFRGNPTSVFTVAELGIMLPHPDGMGELGGFNHPSDFDPTAKDGKPWYCMWEYDTEKYGMKRQLFEGATEAEARAAILIHFLEINLIQVAEVNQRLQNA